MKFLQKVLRHFVDFAPTEFNSEIATKYVFFSIHFNLFFTLFHLVFWPLLILFFFISPKFFSTALLVFMAPYCIGFSLLKWRKSKFENLKSGNWRGIKILVTLDKILSFPPHIAKKLFKWNFGWITKTISKVLSHIGRNLQQRCRNYSIVKITLQTWKKLTRRGKKEPTWLRRLQNHWLDYLLQLLYRLGTATI